MKNNASFIQWPNITINSFGRYTQVFFTTTTETSSPKWSLYTGLTVLYNSELFEKNVGMLDFVILDLDLNLNRYCVWSWDYSAHALHYAIVFFKKDFCFYLVLLLLNVRYLCEYWDSNGWCKLMYLQDYRKPFSSCMPNEEWTHIVLTYYNESENELFYMKWLILDRLTRARLITLWNVWSWFWCTDFFIRANDWLQETKILELM